VTALVVAPDGSWLASADGSGAVRIWDPATAAIRHILTGRTSRALALVVAPDGSWLASADDGGAVRIWDPATAATRHILTGHTRKVTALVVAPDGSWLASADDDGQVRIWDPTSGVPLTSLRVAGSLSHLLLASTTIATAGDHGPYFLTLCHRTHSR
jgi:WD40 repeat protein